MPPEIRGSLSATPPRFSTRALVLASLAALALVFGLFGFLVVPTRLDGRAARPSDDIAAATQLTGTQGAAASAALAAPTTVVSVVPDVVSTGLAPTGLAVESSPSPGPPTSTAVSRCGHQLDEAFGLGRKFIVHRIQEGDTLGTYETAYQTDSATIQRVNAHAIEPLRPNEIIVIPVGQRAVDGVPAFEAFELSESQTTVGKIATMLDSTNLDEFLLYNAITTKCPYFSGWVIVPRPSLAP